MGTVTGNHNWKSWESQSQWIHSHQNSCIYGSVNTEDWGTETLWDLKYQKFYCETVYCETERWHKCGTIATLMDMLMWKEDILRSLRQRNTGNYWLLWEGQLALPRVDPLISFAMQSCQLWNHILTNNKQIQQVSYMNETNITEKRRLSKVGALKIWSSVLSRCWGEGKDGESVIILFQLIFISTNEVKWGENSFWLLWLRMSVVHPKYIILFIQKDSWRKLSQ